MSDPTRQRNTFRRNDKEKARPARTATAASSAAAQSPTAAAAGAICHTSSTSCRAIRPSRRAPAWPTGRSPMQEIEPYYMQAEWEMGISGLRVNSPFVAPMSKDYPVPPVPLKSSGALFNIAAAKLGLTVVPGPLAIITQPYRAAPRA